MDKCLGQVVLFFNDFLHPPKEYVSICPLPPKGGIAGQILHILPGWRDWVACPWPSSLDRYPLCSKEVQGWDAGFSYALNKIKELITKI
jgi:hypothetical protein